MSEQPPPFPDPSRPGAYQPPPPSPAPPPPPVYQAPVGMPMAAPIQAPAASKDGKLVAAGVLSFISGGVVGLLGLWFMSVAQSSSTEWIDDLSGGAITFAAVFLLAGAGLYIVTGIGCVKGRNWGRITAIVVNAILVVLVVLGMFGGGDASGGLVPLAWCGTILGLAWAGKPNS